MTMAEAEPAAKTVAQKLQVKPGDTVAVSDTWSAVRVRPLAEGEAPLG
jgi:DNA-binding GntR family transcriptional regulator